MVYDRNLTILTIDDDRDILESITSILEYEGYNTLAAKDGREGLNLLSRLEDHELPDLILLDYTMPTLNGEDFYRELSLDKRISHIPVVLMTANSNIREIMDQLDVEAYISKPMDVDHILHVAKNFTHRREAARFSFLT